MVSVLVFFTVVAVVLGEGIYLVPMHITFLSTCLLEGAKARGPQSALFSQFQSRRVTIKNVGII